MWQMKTTPQSGFESTRHAVLLSTLDLAEVQNLRSAPVIKLDRYAGCLRRKPAWRVGGVSVVPITPTHGHELQACCVT